MIKAYIDKYKFGLLATVVGALIISAFLAGCQVTSWKYQAELKQEADDKLKQKEGYELLSRALVKRVQEEEAKDRIVYRDINKGVNNATNNTVCLGDDAGKLWDSALFGLPRAATGIDEASARADTTEKTTDREALQNAVDNFEQYKDCRKQLNRLIDFYEHQKK
jgi:hypothetical protein